MKKYQSRSRKRDVFTSSDNDNTNDDNTNNALKPMDTSSSSHNSDQSNKYFQTTSPDQSDSFKVLFDILII